MESSKRRKTPRKRCRECRTFIDSGHERYFLNQVYCSKRCLWRALRHELPGLLKIFLPENLFRKTPPAVWPLYLLNLTTLALVVALGLFLFTRPSPILYPSTPQNADSISQPDSGFSINAAPDAMVLNNKIDISGEAAENTILSLRDNGHLLAVTLAKQQRFQFKNIELKYGKHNLIITAMSPDGTVRNIETLKTQVGSPRIDYLARDITRGNTSRQEIALTFDGGAGNGVTKEILDILESKKLQCTLFLTGQFIHRYPDLVKRMIQNNHEIANHTWSHPHLTTFAENHQHLTLDGITQEKIARELSRTSDLLKKITGQQMVRFWRAPFGEHNLEIRRWAALQGYRHIGWTLGNGETLDTMDWVADTTASYYKTKEEILQDLLSFGENSKTGANGGIILMHLDTQRKEDHPYTILPAYIDSMRQRGYKFVTVKELLNP
jgi:peptidoglycan/xylan/chitin deacetylase (PgdA/CDA1 family)